MPLLLNILTLEVDIASVGQYTDSRGGYCPLGNILTVEVGYCPLGNIMTVEVDIASVGQYTDTKGGYCLC